MSYPFDDTIDLENKELDLELLREALASLLHSINQHQAHLEMLEDEAAYNVLSQIIDDEKGHVAALFKAIQTLDDVQADKFRK